MGVIGLLLSLLGIFISLVVIKEAKPLYSIWISKLGGVHHRNLKIMFGNEEVKNLYSIRLVLWNAGKKEIRKEDIPKIGAGPKISIDNKCKILSHQSITTTGDNSGHLQEENDIYHMQFDYLNKNDAFLTEMYITTIDNSYPKISISGGFKGYTITRGEIHNNSKFDSIFFTITFVFLLSLAFLMFGAAYQTFIKSQIISAWSILFAIIILVLAFFDFKYNIKTIPQKIPKKYLSFLESGYFDINKKT